MTILPPSDFDKLKTLGPTMESLSKGGLVLVLTDDSAYCISTAKTAEDVIRVGIEALRALQRQALDNHDLVTASCLESGARAVETAVMNVKLDDTNNFSERVADLKKRLQ